MMRAAIVAGLALVAALILGRVSGLDVPVLAAEGGAAAGDAGGDAGPGYAGDEACGVCHEEIAAAAARAPHVRDATAAWPGRTCEACHGPGQEHVDAGGGADNIRGLKGVSAPELARTCLACHGGDPHLRGARAGEHVLADVPCTRCHEPHARGVGDALLRKPQAQLCMSCHLDVRAAFAMPYRHGITEGRVECSECHEAHGSRNRGMLKAPDDRTCFTCHADLQGPWVFEHVGVVAEGCNSCHVPHGSANRHLLRYQQVAQLCYQCHTLTPSNHRQPSFRDCTRCHVWVHGSNTDPRFLEP